MLDLGFVSTQRFTQSICSHATHTRIHVAEFQWIFHHTQQSQKHTRRGEEGRSIAQNRRIKGKKEGILKITWRRLHLHVRSLWIQFSPGHSAVLQVGEIPFFSIDSPYYGVFCSPWSQSLMVWSPNLPLLAFNSRFSELGFIWFWFGLDVWLKIERHWGWFVIEDEETVLMV